MEIVFFFQLLLTSFSFFFEFEHGWRDWQLRKSFFSLHSIGFQFVKFYFMYVLQMEMYLIITLVIEMTMRALTQWLQNMQINRKDYL